MKISIVVTTWGVERWVEACRTSLRNAVDAVHCLMRAPEIEIIEICNGNGVSAARNEGLEKATGDYVWFVDGDDTIAKQSLVQLAAVIARHTDVDIVRFEWQLVEYADAFLTQRHRGTEAVEAYDLCVPREKARAYRRHARWILAWNALYRRDFVKDMRFEALVKGEDSLWGRRAFYRAKTLVYLPEKLYEYRQRPDGADQTRDARHYADARQAVWLMCVEGLRVKGIRFWVFFDWIRARFRELPKWYTYRHK